MRRLILLFCLLFVVNSFAGDMFKYGVYLRLRQEYFDNAFDFNDDSTIFKDDNYFRIKASLWGKLNFTDSVSLFAKLTSEPKIAIDSDGKLANNRDTWDEEIFFDNLYLDINDIFGWLDLRVGRQDFLMTHGEGFVIMDGTPYDGSRSFYFNAAKATVRIGENNAIDFIYVDDPAKDEYLPVIDWQDRNVVKTDEDGIIVYGRFKIPENLSLEPYYIYKFEDSTPNLTLNTIGNRIVLNLSTWQVRGELAYQYGEYKGGNDRDAWGGQAYVKKTFKDAKLSPSFEIGYAYLSGDDPTTADDEGWDPVFSKWPWISELYIMGYAIERGEPAYWTNLQLFRAKLDMNITPKTGLSLAYNYLLADESREGVSPFFGDGNERGHLAHIILTHKFDQNIDGHLHFEYFKPGDFYAENNRDDAIFLRWQLQMKF
ncbi:MAG TPA: alginate export family protein [bacterium]|nr:alginate export family protein [bacterium]HPP30471.1 alginate export family protein [bacterium]